MEVLGMLPFDSPLKENQPVLVATDGHSHADTAVVAAAFLAGRAGLDVVAFSAVECLSSREGCDRTSCGARIDADHPARDHSHTTIDEILARRRATVQSQIALTVGESAGWPIAVHAGPLRQISGEVINQTHAQLLVIGQCHQRRLQAPSDACGATDSMLANTIPIYIAAPTFRGIPRRVVVAVDLTDESVCVARSAVRVSAPDANVYLIHVLPHMQPDAFEKRRAWLRQLERALGDGSDVRVESILLVGATAPEILGFADGLQADLIACGTSSFPVFPTDYACTPSLGRVTKELIRRASCSLLIVPRLTDTTR